MIRAFLGIELSPDLRSALAVQQFLLPLPRREPVENLHLTLVFLGETSDAVLEAAHEAFSALRAPAFAMQIEGLGLFGGDRPRLVFAGVAANPALERLQAKVANLARRAGCEIEGRRFLPHVTLGRFPPPAPPDAMRLERAVAEAARFRPPLMPVTDIALFQSHRGRAGSQYEVLARYPLEEVPDQSGSVTGPHSG